MKHPVDSGNACPDAETLAAFVEGRLRDGDRERLAGHIADCDACYFVFTEGARMQPAPTQTAGKVVQNWRGWVQKPRVIWTSAGAAMATAASLRLVVGGGWLARSGGSQSPPELRALVAAVASERTIEPRLTGGFAYGRMRSALRTGESSTIQLSSDVRIAAARIEKDANANRTPQALRLLGIAHLVSGSADRAVSTLEEAANHPNPDARTLSDLSAAYLSRAARTNQREDLTKALAAAERALGSDDKLAEAWFNRAYALERLQLVQQARDAWQDYLKMDPESEWASEARSHVKTLEMPVEPHTPATREPSPAPNPGQPPRPSARPPQPTAAPAPAPAEPAPLARPAPQPAPTSASASVSNAAADQRDIRAVLQAYADAYSRLDAEAVKRAFPGVNEPALRSAFAAMQSNQVALGNEQFVSLTDSAATVSCTWSVAFVGSAGEIQRQSQKTTIRLQKSNGVWMVVDRR